MQTDINTTIKNDQIYNANSIKVLSGLEAIRKNPGMYIGSLDINGIHQLLNEIIDNAVDEVIAEYCDSIYVTLNSDGSCTIEDNGRGIPVDIYQQSGYNKPACEVLLTTLHSGGKFSDGVYSKSSGLHGVGLSCVNALSEWIQLEIWRDGFHFKQSFYRGLPGTELQKTSVSNKTGTKIKFLPDQAIFGDQVRFSCDLITNRLNELAFLHPDLSLHFKEEHTNNEKTFLYKNGIVEFLQNLSCGYKQIPSVPIVMNYASDNLEFATALQWTSSHEEKILSFVNSIHTIYGGTHEQAMRRALTDVINHYAERHKLIDDHESLTIFDIFEGLFCIISLKMNNPVFEGQTKAKLTNENIFDELYQIIYEKFSTILNEKSDLAILIIRKALSSSRARHAARTASDAVVYQYKEIKISEKVYQKQFGVRSKNWHDSAVWITDDELLKKHVEMLEVDKESIGLDVCCGSGVVGASFKPRVSKMIGLDLTPEMVELAKTRLDKVYQGNVYNLPFNDNSFDLVVTREVLHLLPQPEKPLAEIFRVLKPGGQFVVGQILPFGHDDGPWMYRVFKKKQPLIFNMFQEEDFVEMLLRAKFIDMKTKEINVWESIDVWINSCETTIQHRHEIRDLFYNAPIEAKKSHPFKILPSGEVYDLWRWVVFSVRKPK